MGRICRLFSTQAVGGLELRAWQEKDYSVAIR